MRTGRNGNVIGMSEKNPRSIQSRIVGLVVLSTMLAVGCYTESNVSGRAKYRIGYQPDTTYVLQQDVPALVRHGLVYLLANPGQMGSGAEGEQVTIPKGTKIQVSKLVKSSVWAPQSGSWVRPDATFVDGPFAGRFVYVDHVSRQVEAANENVQTSVCVPRDDILLPMTK